MMAGLASRESLAELVGVAAGDVVSVTGAGGKTTLVFTLCDELAAAGGKALVTTTTKMFYPADFPGRILIGGSLAYLVGAFADARSKQVFSARERIAEGKVAGHDADEIDAMAQLLPEATMLVESDGAARKPYKFYREGEPVIASSSTIVVHVVGADALGATMSPALFHRRPQ